MYECLLNLFLKLSISEEIEAAGVPLIQLEGMGQTQTELCVLLGLVRSTDTAAHEIDQVWISPILPQFIDKGVVQSIRLLGERPNPKVLQLETLIHGLGRKQKHDGLFFDDFPCLFRSRIIGMRGKELEIIQALIEVQ